MKAQKNRRQQNQKCEMSFETKNRNRMRLN